MDSHPKLLDSQDIFALLILRHKVFGKKSGDHYKNELTGKSLSAFDLIVEGEIEQAISICSYEWASLPPSRYGQPIKTLKQALSLYYKYYKEETQNISDLKISNEAIIGLLHG